MYEAMEEEEDALTHSINKIWTDIKERDKAEYASREIQGSWRTKRS